MNWLKTLWNSVVSKTSTTPKTTVVVEEVEKEIDNTVAGNIFYDLCREAGIRNKTIVTKEIVEKFKDWYTGEASREEICQSFDKFRESHPELRPFIQSLGE